MKKTYSLNIILLSCGVILLFVLNFSGKEKIFAQNVPQLLAGLNANDVDNHCTLQNNLQIIDAEEEYLVVSCAGFLE